VSANYQNVLQEDPQFTTPYIFIPSTSRLKGAGKNGGDIGANILYRYVNGQLTNERLWDSGSGSFPCGAVIPGVNDAKGSCFDLHVRLNVNATTLAPAYGTTTISAPKNLRVISSNTTP
jgi:hypothetical protein